MAVSDGGPDAGEFHAELLRIIGGQIFGVLLADGVRMGWVGLVILVDRRSGMEG